MGQRAGIEPTLSSSGGVVEREKGGRPPSPKSAWVCETFHQFIVAPSTMKYQKLGSSDMEVSRFCLGTMTFGRQNTEAEAHEQLDYAIKTRGVNFLDTAELYPVPTNRETQGLTEKYVGTWLAKNADIRDKVYVATKVMGYSKTSHIPSGRDPAAQYTAANSDKKAEARLDAENIQSAVDASLRGSRRPTSTCTSCIGPTATSRASAAPFTTTAGTGRTASPLRRPSRALRKSWTRARSRAGGSPTSPASACASFATCATSSGSRTSFPYRTPSLWFTGNLRRSSPRLALLGTSTSACFPGPPSLGAP